MTKREAEVVRILQMKIVKEIKRICQENNFSFFLDAGSMLGAVRHKGFIPWDDDMDVGMLYPDYKKFIKVASAQLGDEFYLDYYPENNECGLVLAKLRLKDTHYVEANSTKRNSKNGIFVDIFPYFFRPENNGKKLFQDFRLLVSAQIFMAQAGMNYWKGNNCITRLKYVPIYIAAKLRSHEFWFSKCEKIVSEVTKSTIIGVHDGASYRRWCYPASFLKEMIWVDFENEKFPIPREYHKILTICYGDYMKLPPIEQRTPGHIITEIEFGPYKKLLEETSYENSI